MTHRECIKLAMESSDLKKYDDLVYTKYQIKNLINHVMQGQISYNTMLEA